MSRLVGIASFVASLGFLAACNDSFQPTIPGTNLFSIYGYLDSAADTQWIRVTRVRSTILTSPEPLDAIVTLRRNGSNETITMRDSVIFFPDTVSASQGSYVHNFWTTQRILPSSTYRFTIAGKDGEYAYADIRIPAALPSAVVGTRLGSTGSGFIRLPGFEIHAITHVRYLYLDDCGDDFKDGYFSEFNSGAVTGFNPVQIAVTRTRPSNQLPCTLAGHQIEVFSSADLWPKGMATSAVGIPEVPGNIHNAFGFIGGVTSKIVPWEDCTYTPAQPNGTFCSLNYNAGTATFRGRILDEHSGDTPLTNATLTVRELLPNLSRVRVVRADYAGRFQISGLDPNVPHSFTVTHQIVQMGVIVAFWIPYTENIIFGFGQTVTRDISMDGLFCILEVCPLWPNPNPHGT